MAAALDGEDISQVEAASQWDEGAWSAGKDGEPYNTDSYLRPLASSAAATRPSSPAPSSRSNIHPSSKQEEDDDMARAIAMSQQELNAPFQQETGLISASGQEMTYGPAMRSDYDQDSWAMVHVPSANEIVPDLDCQDRLHVEGEPRLLKHVAEGDYTSNLLTICHTIGGVHEALLMPERLLQDYGQEKDWWKGQPVKMAKIVDLTTGEAVVSKQEDFLAEIQRLMAFLTASARSYGSIGALTQTEMLRDASAGTTKAGTLLELFLECWRSAAWEGARDMFTTVVGTDRAEASSNFNMSLVDLPVGIRDVEKETLSELLDKLLWQPGATPDHYIERPAHVLVLHPYQTNANTAPKLRVEVPAYFYVDKYLKENITNTRSIRAEMTKGRERIAKIEEIEKKLRTRKHPTKNEQLDTSQLLKHTLGHFSGQNRADVLNSEKTNNVQDQVPSTKPGYDAIARRLHTLIASIDDKLVTLAEEKEKTRKAISDLSNAPPSNLPDNELKHRYTLRGVATKANITYVLSSAAEDEEQMLDADDDTPTGMQWWRMEYDVSSLPYKLTKSKTAGYDVIRAVELEHSSALLVYASDAVANSVELPPALPPPLQKFVENDNALFATELETAARDLANNVSSTAGPQSFDFTDVSRDIIERSSMDSTRVEGAGGGYSPSPPAYNDQDEEFMNHHAYGLPPAKQGYSRAEDQADGDEIVHEITLSPMEGERDGSGMEVEDEGFHQEADGMKKE